jgi:hypothetical protein
MALFERMGRDDRHGLLPYQTASPISQWNLKEMFTLQRLKIPESLHKCLATTNIIESPQGGVERPYAQCDAMAGRGDGAALGGVSLGAYGKALPPH